MDYPLLANFSWQHKNNVKLEKLNNVEKHGKNINGLFSYGSQCGNNFHQMHVGSYLVILRLL